jgi:hypothetical protein
MTKPEIDASAETWGQKVNADLDLLDQHAGSTNAYIAAAPGNINAAVAAAIAAAFPRGVIMAWAGQANQVPAGWLLCNGSNGTPNLTDRFIMGNTGNRTVWEAGGSFTASGGTDAQGGHSHGGASVAHVLSMEEMPYHQHGGGTDATGDHNHTYQAPHIGSGWYIAGGGGTQISGEQVWATSASNIGNHSHNVVTDFRGSNYAHNHGINWDGNHGHNVSVTAVPPYFSLCYIMRA